MEKNTRTRARVHKDTKFMDTTAVAGTSGFYFQRLTAVQLHDILTRCALPFPSAASRV